MLILTRCFGETVIIGEEIKITVQAIKGQQVRLGIDAPKTVSVHREEVYPHIREKNKNDLAQT